MYVVHNYNIRTKSRFFEPNQFFFFKRTEIQKLFRTSQYSTSVSAKAPKYNNTLTRQCRTDTEITIVVSVQLKRCWPLL